MKRIAKFIAVTTICSLLVLPTVTLINAASGSVTIQGDPGGGVRPKA